MVSTLYPIAGISLAVFALTACVSSEEAERQRQAVDSEIAFNVEENEWETPFWERGRAPAKEAAPQASSSLVDATAPVGQLRTNLAVVGASDSLYRELDNAAAEYGFRLIPRPEIQDALANTPACDDVTSLACAEALAAYPGSRLVVNVENGSSVAIMDAASGAVWSATELSSGKQGEELLELVAQRADIAPWAMKAFQGDDGRLYVSAGRANGLEGGDELAIHEPGTLVRAPNGQPITWHKGERVGTLRISELFGSDLASLIPADGQRPSPEHDLILVRD